MKAEELGDNRGRGLKTAESCSLDWMKEGIVERILRTAAIAVVLTLFLAGCARAQSAKADGAEATANTLVTFVELGSVSCIPC